MKTCPTMVDVGRRKFLTGAGIAAAGAAAFYAGEAAKAAEPFMLKSPALEDNGQLAVKNAGNIRSNPNCVGENISPPLAWSNPPEGTKS